MYTADDAARETCNCDFKGLHACILSMLLFRMLIFFSHLLLFFCLFSKYFFQKNNKLKITAGVSNGLNPESGPEVIKLFSCSTQLSMKFHLLIKLKNRQMKKFLALSLSDVVFIMLINVKMPTIIGILTFVSRINFMLS